MFTRPPIRLYRARSSRSCRLSVSLSSVRTLGTGHGMMSIWVRMLTKKGRSTLGGSTHVLQLALPDIRCLAQTGVSPFTDYDGTSTALGTATFIQLLEKRRVSTV
jgi:hypothetical protein